MEMKKRRPLIAGLLSLLTPGMGQVYNGQGKKGIFYFLIYYGILSGLIFLGLHRSFNGMILDIALILGLLLLIAIDAVVGAIRTKAIVLRAYNKAVIYLLPTILYIVLSIGIEWTLHRSPANLLFGIEAFNMPSKSMEPTLVPGDHFMVDRRFYKRHALKKGDIVTFPFPLDPQIIFVQRIACVGGEQVELRDGKVIKVPEGKVFLLGDNYENASDSREWGFVDAKSILGKARYIYWSNDRERIGKEIK